MPMKSLLKFLPVLALVQGCGDPVANRAEELAHELLIVDTHIDVPYRLHREWQDISQATAEGDFDYPRAKAGGLDAPFMSIYIPPKVDAEGDAFAMAKALIDSMQDIVNQSPDKFALATCADDLMAIKASGRIALPFGMENGGPIDGDFANLRHFHDRGIRYITLAHGKSNHISDSSYDTFKRWQGLSPFGKELVGEMNRLGTMIDVSHLSDQAFWQVLELSEAPVVATHSSLRHFTPGFERNMSDEMVAALGENGGVIHIPFGSIFLTPAAGAYSNAQRKAALGFAFANHLDEEDPRIADFMAQYRQENAYPYATLDDVLDHFDRAVDLAGIEGVGIGSDYDGVGDSLAIGLKDASTYPNLIRGLLGRGYSETDIEKILSGNLLRIWRAAEARAESHGNAPRCSVAAGGSATQA